MLPWWWRWCDSDQKKIYREETSKSLWCICFRFEILTQSPPKQRHFCKEDVTGALNRSSYTFFLGMVELWHCASCWFEFMVQNFFSTPFPAVIFIKKVHPVGLSCGNWGRKQQRSYLWPSVSLFFLLYVLTYKHSYYDKKHEEKHRYNDSYNDFDAW